MKENFQYSSASVATNLSSWRHGPLNSTEGLAGDRSERDERGESRSII